MWYNTERIPIRTHDPMLKFLLSLLFLPLACFGAPSSLGSLYATLDPTSVAQHFAFYELYPKTIEGKKALRHAWELLSRGSQESDPELILPAIDVQPIVSLVNRSDENAPVLEEQQLMVIEKLSRHLGNRKLLGFGLWDEQEIGKLEPNQIDLGRGLLLAEMGADPSKKNAIRSYEASIDLMALQILARLPDQANPLDKVRAINDYIFNEMRFRFPPHSLCATDVDVYTFLPSVLDSRRGVCLGVSILYLCLAQRLELKLEAVTPPGHIYVRYVDADGNITNIETTARGIDVPTEHYLGIETKHLQTRTIREVMGLAFMNQAAVSWHQENAEQAIFLYEKAKQFLPGDYLLHLFLGFNYLFVGKEKEGRSLLEQVQGNAPEHVITGDTIAEDYLNGLTNAEGIQAVFTTVDENRNSILEKQKKLMEITEKYPRFRQGIFHLAITWMQLGREKEALPILERYAKLHPVDPTVQYYLSAIHFQRHHFNEAWVHLRHAEAILDKKEHHPRALSDLRKALQRQCPEKI